MLIKDNHLAWLEAAGGPGQPDPMEMDMNMNPAGHGAKQTTPANIADKAETV